MNPRCKVAFAMVIGAALGGAAIQGLHAQAKAPVYFVQEIDVSNLDPYVKEFVPKVRASVEAFGGHSLTLGSGKVTPIGGAPPKPRVVIQRWASMEEFQKWYNSAQYKELRKIGNKYAAFRSYTVEGVAE